jgi:two-component system chemotaxis response regulator CheY
MLANSGSPQTPRKFSSIKALVIDDSGPLRLLIVNYLTVIGFKDIDQANDGIDALIKVENNKYGIIFTDWDMPNITGYGLIQVLRQKPSTQHIPIVLISGNATKGRSSPAESGADAFVPKPFVQADLRKAIETVLSGR